MTGRSRFRFRFRGVMSLVKSIASQFFDILQKEEAASNTNVFYDPADLTSLRVGTDGSGGNPAVGDPVGVMLDTSQFGGKTAEDYLAGATELYDDANFTDDSVGTGSATVSDGVITLTTADGSNYALASVAFTAVVDQWYKITFTATKVTGVVSDVYVSDVNLDNLNANYSGNPPKTHTVFVRAQNTAAKVRYQTAGNNSAVFEISNISVKEIPGHHAIAPSDSARPVLFDDPDLTAAALTDNGRGEELVTNGTFDTDVSGWTAGNATLTLSSGAIRITSDSNGEAYAYQFFATEIGAEYEVSIDTVADASTANLFAKIGSALNSGNVANEDISSVGVNSFTFRARHLTTFITLQCGGATLQDEYAEFDNISVRKVLTAFDERGPELQPFDGAESSSLSTGGSTDSYTPSTKTFEVSSVGTISSYPRYMWNDVFVVGETYDIDITFDSSDGIVSLADATAANAPGTTISESGGRIQGTLTAAHTNLVLLFDGRSTFSVSITSASVKKVLYPNLNPNSTFDDATGYTLSASAPPSISAGVLDFAANSGGASQAAINVVAADCSWHLAMFYASEAGELYVRVNQGDFAIHTVSAGWNLVYVRSGSGNTQFLIRANQVNDYTGTVDNLQLYELPASIDRKYYLDTDGSDDWMEVKPTLNLGEQWWHVGAWQSDTNGGFAFSVTTGTQSAALKDGSNVWRWMDPTGAHVPVSTSDPATKAVVTVEKADTNSLSARYNGVTEVDPITPNDDTAETYQLSLFSGDSDAYSSGLDGRFYGGSWGQGQVDYDELTVLQDYLGTTTQPPIDPPDVTEYADVYELLAAQTGAVLFDINDKTSLRVGRDGSGGVPVDGDPVGMMLDVSDTGGQTMAAKLAGATELVTNGGFDTGDTTNWVEEVVNSGVLGYPTVSGGGVEVARDSSNNQGRVYQAFATETGAAYELTGFVEDVSGSGQNDIFVSTGIDPYTNAEEFNPSAGEFSFTFVADGATSYVILAIGTVGAGTTIRRYKNISVKEISSHAAIAPSDSARPTLASYNSPISSREVLTTTYSWTITDGGRA